MRRMLLDHLYGTVPVVRNPYIVRIIKYNGNNITDDLIVVNN
jgi:hypothetical protein